MEIRPSGSAASRRAPPADYFTGAVWQDPIVEAPAPGNARASVVRFEPGARTAWHTHPAGQTLYILSGVGRVQSFGGPIREVRAGDVIWFPANAKHWHGAGPQPTYRVLLGGQEHWFHSAAEVDRFREQERERLGRDLVVGD